MYYERQHFCGIPLKLVERVFISPTLIGFYWVVVMESIVYNFKKHPYQLVLNGITGTNHNLICSFLTNLECLGFDNKNIFQVVMYVRQPIKQKGVSLIERTFVCLLVKVNKIYIKHETCIWR
jgi:hypothetical protein